MKCNRKFRHKKKTWCFPTLFYNTKGNAIFWATFFCLNNTTISYNQCSQKQRVLQAKRLWSKISLIAHWWVCLHWQTIFSLLCINDIPFLLKAVEINIAITRELRTTTSPTRTTVTTPCTTNHPSTFLVFFVHTDSSSAQFPKPIYSDSPVCSYHPLHQSTMGHALKDSTIHFQYCLY